MLRLLCIPPFTQSNIQGAEIGIGKCLLYMYDLTHFAFIGYDYIKCMDPALFSLVWYWYGHVVFLFSIIHVL